MKVDNKGSVVKIYSSGIVESDKGFKFPFNRANIGDMMIDVDGDRMVVTKEVYKEKFQTRKPRVKKEEETDEKA